MPSAPATSGNISASRSVNLIVKRFKG